VKHLGRAVSHGCVRLSPDHAATLYSLIKAQGMSETKVVVAGHTPGGDNAPVARSHMPMNETVSSDQGYSQQPSAYYGQQGYGQQSYVQPTYGQRSYGQPNYVQRPYPTQSYYAQPGYDAPPHMRRPTAGRATGSGDTPRLGE